MDDALKNFDPLTATNKQKGNLGEMASHNNMLKPKSVNGKNYNLKDLLGDPPTGLNDKIKKGIDGIYENTTPPPKFVIDEAKYGKSTLNQKTRSGPQMSDNWVKDRLEKQLGVDKADEVAHAHKEIVPTDKVTNGNYKPKHAQTYDDLGSPTSKNDWDANHIPIQP